MPSPPIQLFLTTIASQPALRQRQGQEDPFTSYDLASDEAAKRLWKRKAPLDKQQLPGILVGGKFPGTFAEFEDSVEYDELDVFLRLKESWNPDVDEHIAPPVQPIGVPGAAMPLDMTPERLRDKVKAQPTSSSLADKKPIPVNKREGELDLGDELSGFGLQGLKITGDELRDLIAELGMDGDDAGDLLKGLGGEAKDEKEAENDEREASPSPEEKPAKEKKSEEAKK
ncbi:hypothetical protein CPB85DRAFT_1431212 [Mucidula mucida]|nr:hypothetical protein CPB85DRAFT_1431212 [Mucidula mucida]